MGDKNKNGTKITILGAGNVGATIAYTFAVAGTCSDVVLVDIDMAVERHSVELAGIVARIAVPFLFEVGNLVAVLALHLFKKMLHLLQGNILAVLMVYFNFHFIRF